MKKARVSLLVLVALLIAGIVAGCAVAPEQQTPAVQGPAQQEPEQEPEEEEEPQEPVNITFLNTKGEIAAQLEEVANLFSDENPGITLEIIPVAAGISPFQTLTVLYNAGNAPSLSMIDSGDFPRLKDNFLSLNDERWMADVLEGSTTASTFDGVNYGFPFTIEGFGFIYNREVLNQAFGGNFDPASITTRAALKDAFDRVEATGADALVISPMDWSLGAHMFSLFYLAVGEGNQAAYDSLFEDLKAGNADLANNQDFNNWLDTFDMLKSYNWAIDDPLSITYEKGPELLGKSEIGFWFMGNWAWPQIYQFDTTGGQFGFVPFPMSDNAADFGNDSIVAFASKRVAVDKAQNSAEQQEAAKTFLNWLVYEESGQQALVQTLNIIPAFTNITIPVADPLGQSISALMASGNSMAAIDSYSLLPPDHWARVGASLQKYLGGHTDRAGLASEIEEYWSNVE